MIREILFLKISSFLSGARMAQSVSTRPWSKEVVSSIPRFSHPCFDFFPFRVAKKLKINPEQKKLDLNG